MVWGAAPGADQRRASSAGTAHPRRGTNPFVDMRHRSTPRWPANGTRWVRNGSNRRWTTSRQPVDDALPPVVAGCYLRPHRVSPAPPDHLDRDLCV